MKRQNQLQLMTEEEKRVEYDRFWSADEQSFFPPITIAIVLNKSLAWLQKKRCDGGGIPFTKPSGNKIVFYKKSDVLDFLNSKKMHHTT